MKFEADYEIRSGALTCAQLRDAYIDVGFTREEAIDLIKTILSKPS